MPQLISGITGVLAAFKATAVGAWLTGKFTGRLLASVAWSALQGALLAPPQQNGGFTAQYTANGGTNPCSFVLGLYGIGGQNVCPPMTHGKSGKTPNAYLTYVIKLGDIPGQSLERVQIDGVYVARGSTPHPDYGLPATGRYAGYAWFKFYDGSQTVADPMLLAKYGTYPERPWLADMVGTGTPYVICTFRYNRELFGGLPQNLFESGGIPLYDPRFDTTVGGAGAQRWGNMATYVRSTNNAVIDYNIARGITIPQLGVWGGDFIAEDLPLGNWFAAMNACDLMVGSPLRPQFQGGYPVQVNMEPAAVMEEFGKGCTAQFAEVGGVLKMRVGGPGLPILFITDADVIVSRPQDYQSFPNAASRQNGIEARYADPAVGWKDKAAPPRYNSTWEAEDGARRTTSIDLPACSDSDQAQRVMAAYITDARRGRSVGMTLPPDAAVLEPLDVLNLSSVIHNFSNKLFEVSQLADDMLTMLQRISVRECDPADFTPPSGLVVPGSPSSAPVIPVAQTVPGWVAAPFVVADGASAARGPGLIGIWDPAELDDVTGVEYQVRVSATGVVKEVGQVPLDEGKVIVSAQILRNTAYQMRARLVVTGRPSDWTAWTAVQSPDIAPVQGGDIGLGAVAYGNLIGPQTGVGLNADRFCRDATAWKAIVGAFSIVPDTTAPGGSSLQSSTIAGQFLSQRFAIDRLRNHVAHITIRRTAGAASTYLMVAFQDASGANITTAETGGLIGWPSASTYFYFGLTEQVPPASNTKYSIAFGPDEVAKIPPTAAFAQIGFLSNFSGGAGTQAISDADIYERVGSGQIVNNAVLSQHTALVPGNMVSNPQFATGDLRDWRPYVANTPANQSLVPRVTAGVPAGAPTANVMRYNFGVGGETIITTFAGATAYDLPNSADCAIPTIVGQAYRVSIDAARSASGSLAGFDVLIHCLGANGSIGTFSTAISMASLLTTSWATYSGTFVAPAGTVAVWPYVSGAMGETGEVYWTNLAMRTIANADLIDAGAIKNFHLGENIIEAQNFAAGVKPVEVFSALPATGNSLGRQVILTSEPRRLYTHTGSPSGAAGFTSELLGEDLRPGSVTTGKLAAASVTTTILAAGAVTADKVLITGRGGALNADPNFTDGTAWSGQSAPNIVTITDGVAGDKAMRGLATFDSHFLSEQFAVNPNSKYSLSAWYRRDATANGVLYLRMFFYNAAGAYLGYKENGFIPTATFVRLQDTNITPTAGSAFAKLYAIPNYGGTLGYHEVQGFGCYEMNGAALTVIGGIKADQIDVGSLSAISANVGTLTAGVLQSPNYVALTSGSKINLTTGDAELNSLVVRSSMIFPGAVNRPAIQDGAVSDQLQVIALGPFSVSTTKTTLLTFDLGAQSRGQIRKRALVFDGRKVSGWFSPIVTLERRRASLGGAFTVWENLQSFTLDSPTVWEMFADSGTFAGDYDDYEMRVTIEVADSRYNSTHLVIRNIYLTTVLVTK